MLQINGGEMRKNPGKNLDTLEIDDSDEILSEDEEDPITESRRTKPYISS